MMMNLCFAMAFSFGGFLSSSRFRRACSATRRARIIFTWSSISAPCARGIAHLDQGRELAMHGEHAARDLRRQRAVLRRPRHVLERDELRHQHAVVRGLGDRQMKVAA